uniref:Ras-associating domain-containing protein n=1 Tax=Setaria digitata TaxID=48799 RepID=A0A915Q2I7_9BILA
MSTDENPNDSGQISNDSGIAAEDLWFQTVTKPFAEKTLITACSPFGIVSSRSFTAPSTPASAVFWKGSEFSPSTAFSHRRSTSGCWDRKHQSSDASAHTSLNSNGNVKNSLPRSRTPVSNDITSCSERSGIFSKKINDTARTTETSSNAYILRSSLHQTTPFHLARIALDETLKNDVGTANYKCIKIENGDRMAQLIERILEKHLICGDHSEYCLVQLLPDGCEFCLPEKCNPYYAVAPDPTSTMLNFVLRRKSDAEREAVSGGIAPSTKKLNRMKRCNLLRWSSGYL